MRKFYRRQNEWAGVQLGPVSDIHRGRAAAVHRQLAGARARVLELGAGGGQTAAAIVDQGHRVTAIEQCASSAGRARQLASERSPGALAVVEGDFFEVALRGRFELVGMWGSFGLGADADQRRLLRRVASEWLHERGVVLVEVLTPWYWARHAGRGWQHGAAAHRYDFDPTGCRVLDHWWPLADESSVVTASTRAYSPADLRLLLEGTGLALKSWTSGGAFDFDNLARLEKVLMKHAMSYVAELVHEGPA